MPPVGPETRARPASMEASRHRFGHGSDVEAWRCHRFTLKRALAGTETGLRRPTPPDIRRRPRRELSQDHTGTVPRMSSSRTGPPPCEPDPVHPPVDCTAKNSTEFVATHYLAQWFLWLEAPNRHVFVLPVTRRHESQLRAVTHRIQLVHHRENPLVNPHRANTEPGAWPVPPSRGTGVMRTGNRTVALTERLQTVTVGLPTHPLRPRRLPGSWIESAFWSGPTTLCHRPALDGSPFQPRPLCPENGLRSQPGGE